MHMFPSDVLRNNVPVIDMACNGTISHGTRFLTPTISHKKVSFLFRIEHNFSVKKTHNLLHFFWYKR